MGAELFHVDGRTDRHDEADNLFFLSEILRKLPTSKTLPVLTQAQNVCGRNFYLAGYVGSINIAGLTGGVCRRSLLSPILPYPVTEYMYC